MFTITVLGAHFSASIERLYFFINLRKGVDIQGLFCVDSFNVDGGVENILLFHFSN